MSTRFEKRIIMPRGAMGPTTLLDLPRDDRRSVSRWHRSEWEQFLAEVKAFKNKALTKVVDARLWDWEHRQKCEGCARRRRALMLAVKAFKGPRSQRGSILLSAFQGAGGSGDCSFTASTIPSISDFCIEPCVARCRARLHTDGDWYWTEGTTSWGSSRGTWDGDCAISDYDSRWNLNSGNTPNEGVSGTDGVWSDASVTGAAVGYSRTFGIYSGSFDVEIRDGTSLNVLFTDAFSMFVEVEARN